MSTQYEAAVKELADLQRIVDDGNASNEDVMSWAQLAMAHALLAIAEQLSRLADRP